MYSVHSDRALPLPGFPIRKSPGQSLFNGSPKLIAVYRVLHRLSLPRHPPYALNSLTIKNQIKSINIQFQAETYALSMLLLPKLPIHYAIVKELKNGSRFRVLGSRLTSNFELGTLNGFYWWR
jgi:hypothetical protein